MVEMRFNGKRITSSYQLKRELEKSLTSALERSIRNAAPPGVRLTKTSDGFRAEGTDNEIKRMVDRLKR